MKRVTSSSAKARRAKTTISLEFQKLLRKDFSGFDLTHQLVRALNQLFNEPQGIAEAVVSPFLA